VSASAYCLSSSSATQIARIRVEKLTVVLTPGNNRGRVGPRFLLRVHDLQDGARLARALAGSLVERLVEQLHRIQNPQLQQSRPDAKAQLECNPIFSSRSARSARERGTFRRPFR
jgi:hypothetical protein